MAKRLVKIAKELNVGTATIVDHLVNHGYDIENKPTAKVTDAMYNELLKEFSKSIAIKEQADQLVIGNRPNGKKDQPEKSELEEPTPEVNPSTNGTSQTPAQEAEVQSKEDNSSNKVEEPKVDIAAKANAPKLKVVGKIDLGSRLKNIAQDKKQAKEPKKESAPPKVETPVEAKVAEPVSPPKPEKASQPAPAQVEKKAVQEQPVAKAEPKPEPQPKPEPKPEPKPVAQPEAKKEIKEEKKEPVAKTPPPPAPAKKEPVPENKRPERKEKPQPKKEKAAPKAPEVKVEKETPKVETPVNVVDNKNETPAPPEKGKAESTSSETDSAKTEDEGQRPGTFRAKSPELRGLKILGKIDTNKFNRPKKKKEKEAPKDRDRNKQDGQNRDNRQRPPRGSGDSRSGDSRSGDSRTGDRDRRDRDRSGRPDDRNRQGSGRRNDQQGQNRQNQGSNAGAGGDNRNKTDKKPGGNDNSSDAAKRRKRKRKTVSSPSSNNNNRQGGGGDRGRGGDRRRGNRPGQNQSNEPKEVSKKEIEEKIKATMARISGGGKKRRQKLRRENRERMRDKQEQIELEKQSDKLQVTEFISVQELANLMDVAATDVIMTCMNLGVIVSINQRLDAEIIELVAEEYGHEIEFISAEEQVEEEEEYVDDPESLKPRAPIVTVMGHVDHGKTSLLDYIRSASVASGEAGGITQHIGAYEVNVEENKKITFLDTPGHEAFTAMRARGAKVTDIAIVIIAADDNIMPQTKEAISHAQAAGVPIVFAINKIDKDGAQPERIKQELANMNLLVEEWGGSFQSQDISAKTGLNIDLLLEKVLLEAELLELQANPERPAVGTVIEASLDKGRGYVTKMLVQTGTLGIGDPIVAGEHSGKIKAMFNEHGKRIKKAGPSAPVLVLGLGGAPQAGERFKEVETEQEARQIASKRAQISREQANRATKRISLDEIGRRLALGTFKELNLIVKGDVDGSIEALSDSLIKQSIESVQVNVIHKAVGQIIESDVLLASASDAIIIGFQVRPSIGARKLAEREGVEIKLYSIIYNAIEELKMAIEGMLEPTKEENIVAQVEVRETYKISKVGTVAGCYVQEGKINRNNHIRLIRNGIVVYPTKEGVVGEMASLKRFKDDVKEVKNGMECGISIKNFNDIKVGDVIEAYEIIEIKQTLK